MFHRVYSRVDRLLLAVIFTCVISTSGKSADEATAEQKAPLTQQERQERLDRIAEEIRRRRGERGDSSEDADPAKEQKDRRRYNPLINGAVYPARSTAFAEGPVRLVISRLPLCAAGEIYAKLINKEVMISGRVAARAINVKCEGVSRTEAIAEFDRVLADAGVMIAQVDEATVALLARGSERTKGGGEPGATDNPDGAQRSREDH